MANRRQLVKRRKSVQNIRKITRTMQLIATARFQAALGRATAARPYTDKMAELVGSISAAAGEARHPLMRESGDAKRTALVIITSMRGLCGGYNANVLRTAIAHVEELKGRGIETDVHMVGKKGAAYFKFLRRPTREQTTNLGDSPRFDQVEPIANGLMKRFVDGEIDSAYVASMRFFSAARQRPEVIQLLPLAREQKPGAAGEGVTAAGAEAGSAVEYEFSPAPAELLEELLPATVRIRLFQCFNDAIVSEQIARMVAMKAATDAAGDMITSLTRQYNRARQTHITMELLDIVGGANALA